MSDGLTVRRVTRAHRGERTEHELPEGFGGLVGMATISGAPRLISPDDVIFEYGSLREWQLIPTQDFRRAQLPYATLKELLKKEFEKTKKEEDIPSDKTQSI